MIIKNSIRNKLITSVVCLAIVPIFIIGAILSWQNFIAQKKQMKELQEALTLKLSENLSLFMHEQELKIVSFLKANYLPDFTLEQRSNSLLKFLSSSSDDWHGHVFNDIALLDVSGREVVRHSRIRLFTAADLADRSNAEAFLVPFRTGEIYYGPVYFDEISGSPLMKIAVPVKDIRTLSLTGVIVSEMNLMSMRKLVADTKIGQNGTAFIVDQNGRLVVHPNPSVILKNIYFPIPEKTKIMHGVRGEKAFVTAVSLKLNAKSLFIVTEIPAIEAFQHTYRAMIIIGAVILFTLAGVVTLGFIIIREIIKPIESLASKARAITRGDITQKVQLKKMEELNDLAEAFNTMASRLLGSIKQLENEKNFVRNTIESLTHPFYVIDVQDYSIKLANSAANFGPHPEGKKCYMLTHKSDKPCGGPNHPCTIELIRKTRKPVVFEHIHCMSDAGPRSHEVYGYPIFNENGEVSLIIEYNVDITEKKLLEEQLRQSQKLEAIGSLAGGVAHDFNNILTAILGYSEIVLQKLPQDDSLRPHVDAIHAAGDRASSLTRQLLAFSRKQMMELRVINLNDLLHNMTKMLGRLISEDIEMKLVLRDTAGNIKADPSQIEQIIMNLAVNARDAMPDGGSLIFETDTVVLDEEYCRSHAEVSPGPYILLVVADTGCGFTQEVKEKIFDPFFTTKEKGKGTGLGLSTIYGIMKQLQGHIFVYSELGCGTTFKIYFHEEKKTAAEAVEKSTGKTITMIQEGAETILVVDDEPTIRHMIFDTLQPLGYQVIDASCGKKALEICKTTARNIDLLITDVIMPGMNGRELAEKVKPIRPGMKVLFMSGYTDNVIAHQGVLEHGINFINKPLVPSLLSKKIRKILDKT